MMITADSTADDVTLVKPDGMLILRSAYGSHTTMDRFVQAVTARGMIIFARIDHSAGASEAGLMLRPTELLIFGNARSGTPLMRAMQTISIDLPLKALVWKDDSGTTWLGYNDPFWIGHRHGLGAGLISLLRIMGDTLAAVAREATGDTGGTG